MKIYVQAVSKKIKVCQEAFINESNLFLFLIQVFGVILLKALELDTLDDGWTWHMEKH